MISSTQFSLPFLRSFLIENVTINYLALEINNSIFGLQCGIALGLNQLSVFSSVVLTLPTIHSWLAHAIREDEYSWTAWNMYEPLLRSSAHSVPSLFEGEHMLTIDNGNAE